MLDHPLDLAGRRASGRVLFGPHETNLADGRAIADRHVAYYARRAEGGAGVIVTEIASVHDSDWPYERAPLAAESASGWVETAHACHRHGSLVLAGLGHAGSQGSSAFSQSPLWAPSRVADVVSRELPMELEGDQIRALLEGFSASTELAVQSGMDGVEVNAGQHSIVRQFLSGLTNTRADRYGQDRTRLLREVLRAVRSRLDDRILGLRLCCDELAPWAGITPQQAAAVAAEIAPEVDYLVVVRGSAMTVSATRPDSHTEPGFTVDLCRTIREAVGHGTTLAVQGSIVDPEQACSVLDDGVAELVEMTRAQIADPELVRKFSAGHPARIRPCTLTNQKCRVRDDRNPVVSCVGEPRSGHETVDPPVEGRPHPSTTAETALVVGGGPAGMEAARVLALRGHAVRLVEREPELGGMLAVAARVPGRSRLRRLVHWYDAELRRLGVDIRTGTEFTADDPGSASWLLLTTGSLPGPRNYTVHDGASVVDVVDVLRGEELPPGPVVLHDPVGDAVGVGVAELFAGAGRPTTLVTPDQVAGTQLAITGDLADANGRLQRAGVRLAKRSILRSVHSGHIVVTDVFTGEPAELECVTLVHCGHRLPDDRIDAPHALSAGDRVAPRTVHEAVLEGRRTAMTLVGEAG